MTRFYFSSLLVFALFGACGATRMQQPMPGLTGTRLDVDINGNMYVLDANRNLLTLSNGDSALRKEVGGAGWENDQFDKPSGLWARNGIDVFVADYGNHRIQRFDRGLSFVSSLSTRENANPEERFGYPLDVAVSRLGDLFICDGENARIVKVNRFTKVERTFGGFDAGKGRLLRPSQLEVGPRDQVYVLDQARVMVFDNFGNFVHELLPGGFRTLRTLYADNGSLVVLDGDTLYCFDENERPVRSIVLESLGIEAGISVHAIAFTGGSMYVLTAKGLQRVPDPRPGQADLDKEEKSQ